MLKILQRFISSPVGGELNTSIFLFSIKTQFSIFFNFFYVALKLASTLQSNFLYILRDVVFYLVLYKIHLEMHR